MSDEHEKHDDKDGGLIAGLKALDEAIIKSLGEGPPGSGFYALVSAASAQLLGVKAPPFPTAPAAVDKLVEKSPDPKAETKQSEPIKHEPPTPPKPASPPPAGRK